MGAVFQKTNPVASAAKAALVLENSDDDGANEGERKAGSGNVELRDPIGMRCQVHGENPLSERRGTYQNEEVLKRAGKVC